MNPAAQKLVPSMNFNNSNSQFLASSRRGLFERATFAAGCSYLTGICRLTAQQRPPPLPASSVCDTIAGFVLFLQAWHWVEHVASLLVLGRLPTGGCAFASIVYSMLVAEGRSLATALAS